MPKKKNEDFVGESATPPTREDGVSAERSRVVRL
jgi:hypothetical protein